MPLTGDPSAGALRGEGRVSTWLSRPLSRTGCALGWLVATGVFIALVSVVGIPSEGDARVTAIIGWALAHGQYACGYPPGSISRNLAAPIYPLISGAGSALFRIGHHVPFPTSAALGPRCATAYTAIDAWAVRSGAWGPTLHIGYVGWFGLMAGVVALLRASGRGRTRWEPVALLFLALTPPVSMCLVEYFHPQDLLAMGIALAALAAIKRDRWAVAGALVGLSLITQQFTLLVLAPMLILVPRRRRNAFFATLIGAVVVVAVPVLLFTSGRAIKSLVLGTGGQLYSFSLFDETGLRSPLIFVLARFLPLAAALIVAWWAHERLGDRLLDPGPLLSLVATCLCLRLVFEVNVLGYYFMAVSVLLIIADIIRGRLRLALVLWIAAVTLVTLNVIDANPSFHAVVFWQVLLVAGALVLAIRPLVIAARDEQRPVASIQS